MRERAFVEQNKQKWLAIEEKIKNNEPIDQLFDIYNEFSNDLSFARTYYPKSKLVPFLNEIVAALHLQIYRKNHYTQNGFIEFWKTKMPLLFYQYRVYLIVSFAFFILSALIGVVSSVNDEDFVSKILGSHYVNMTIENIENGDPLAVYSSGSTWGSAFGIIWNNIRVGLLSYVLGIFFGIGTLYVLFNNGVMVGAFQYFFAKYNVLLISISGIWIHGAMEIFSIGIEGGAGLILGTSLLFPGTYKRIDALKKAAKDSVLILISTFPFTIAAGILEGYVTRHYNDMPMALAFAIIIISFGIIFFYYFLYPIWVNKRVNLEKNRA
ncbi:MAG: stage II sporulation protein M [Flavobacteriales bacterium]|jgi:uncharacterized membrane protein SpoIIM required for sporulation|nr:stage II sporulation protein M [Flavobacteriales bacterium]